jgi:hypothetical protein
VVRIISEWLEGIQGPDEKDRAHMHGLSLLYYLGTGTHYAQRTILTLAQYFALLKRELGDIVTLMVTFGKALANDKSDIHEAMCKYLMEYY